MNPEMLLTFLCRHLVNLAYYDRSPERAQEFSGRGRLTYLSGFIIRVRGLWNLITAGHVLSDLERAIEHGQRLEEWQLDDTFNWRATDLHTIPFDFLGAPRFHINRDGYDYGVILLRDHYQTLLTANGIKAVGEESWEKTWPQDFTQYAMLGIPSQLVREVPGRPGAAERGVALLGLTKIDYPPEVLRQPAERFYGRLDLAAKRTAGTSIDDIDGMSGGPIIAFKPSDDGRLRYWVVAVQSGWDRATQTIAACPIQQFIRDLAAQIDRWHTEGGQSVTRDGR